MEKIAAILSDDPYMLNHVANPDFADDLDHWRSPQDPGGPTGQELMLNFIEVEPYCEN